MIDTSHHMFCVDIIESGEQLSQSVFRRVNDPKKTDNGSDSKILGQGGFARTVNSASASVQLQRFRKVAEPHLQRFGRGYLFPPLLVLCYDRRKWRTVTYCETK